MTRETEFSSNDSTFDGTRGKKEERKKKLLFLVLIKINHVKLKHTVYSILSVSHKHCWIIMILKEEG